MSGAPPASGSGRPGAAGGVPPGSAKDVGAKDATGKSPSGRATGVVRAAADSAPSVKDVSRTEFLVSQRRPAVEGGRPTARLPAMSQRDSLYLIVTGDLRPDELAALKSQAEKDAELAADYAAMRRHLEFHRALRPVRLPGGAFQRLTARMRKDGYLSFAYPGSHCLFRRAFTAAVLVVCAAIATLFIFTGTEAATGPAPTGLLGTITPVNEHGEPSGQLRSVDPRNDQTVESGTADLWLPATGRGASTKVRLSEGARFRASATNRLELKDGEARSVDVEDAATVTEDFVLSTPRAEIATQGARFAVVTDDAQTRITVLRGWVRVQTIGTGYARKVLAGEATRVRAGDPPTQPEPVVAITLERYPLTLDRYSSSRMVLVTVSNTSLLALDIDKAGSGFPYQLSVVQDKSGVSGDPFSTQDTLKPMSGLPVQKAGATGFEMHSGTATLNREGRGGSFTYQFVADLRSILAPIEASDCTLWVEYTGTVKLSGEEGTVIPCHIVSRALRFDLKAPGD